MEKTATAFHAVKVDMYLIKSQLEIEVSYIDKKKEGINKGITFDYTGIILVVWKCLCLLYWNVKFVRLVLRWNVKQSF